MILFVVPTSVALANRPPRPPAPLRHISLWRLLGGEVVHGVRRLRAAARRFARRFRRQRDDRAVAPYAFLDEWAHDQRLVPARVKS